MKTSPASRTTLLLATVTLQAIIGGCSISRSDAWTFSASLTSRTTTKASTSTTSTSSTSLDMGSKAATKWGRKQEWLKSRGLGSSSSDDNDETSTTGGEAPFACIVGNGRIGGALSKAGNCVVLGRGDSIDADGEGPILLATRNDALDSIIDNCPEGRRKDLVFLQNGYLDDFLESKGLSDNTQVLLYLSVAAKGLEPTDGVTTFNPEGLTASTGEWAESFADRLAILDLKCNVVSAKDYRPAMFEKLMWISTYMLVGAANGCATVGDAGRDHGETVERIVNELVAAVSAKEGIEFPVGTLDRLKSYTDVVADFPCGVKEFEWRNQYFWELGDESAPTHNGLLRECAEKGILSFELPN